MRLVWMAITCGAWIGCGSAMAAAAGPATTQPSVALHECLLEHPLRLSSVAARCGVLSVAENPVGPAGARIDLHIAVVPALNRRATAAPLFILAGGPGQAASDLYTSFTPAFIRINRNHDIVMLDQRGTGHSAPLRCNYPDDWQAEASDLTQLRQATLACLATLGDRVRFYTTSVAVGDLEAVRRALGYARIDLYGSSYGTRVAQLYMRRFPDATQAVILDGVTYPEQALGPDTPIDGERALDLILSRCTQAPECAAAYPALRQDLDLLRRRFGPDRQSVALSDPSSGAPLTIEFNRNLLNGALRFLSYNATEASLLPTLIHQGAAGSLGPLAAQTLMMARQIGDQLASGMQNSVVCSEDEPLFAGMKIDRERIARTYQGADQLDALAQICSVWPRGPVDAALHDRLHSDVPTLLLSGDADPVTPPEDAARAARELRHHRSLVLAGEGHGQAATGCMPRLMAQFLDDPAPESLDARCLDEDRPAPFFISPTGPAP
jgi:pimeloyl-ACP methyl ester carboxylesterase